MLSVCLCIPPINFRMPEPTFMKRCMCIIARKPISTACFINPSHQSLPLYVYPHIIARQQLGKNVTRATNTHAIIEELLVASFSMRSASHQRKVWDWFPRIFFFWWLSLVSEHWREIQTWAEIRTVYCLSKYIGKQKYLEYSYVISRLKLENIHHPWSTS
jgi:hypothetical protein